MIAADGRLNDCEVSGQVTNAAAVAAVKEATGLMRSAAQTVDGAPAAGAHVQIPFQWDWLLASLKAAS